jgi:hypothetical protein
VIGIFLEVEVVSVAGLVLKSFLEVLKVSCGLITAVKLLTRAVMSLLST